MVDLLIIILAGVTLLLIFYGTSLYVKRYRKRHYWFKALDKEIYTIEDLREMCVRASSWKTCAIGVFLGQPRNPQFRNRYGKDYEKLRGMGVDFNSHIIRMRSTFLVGDTQLFNESREKAMHILRGILYYKKFRQF